MPCVFEVFSFRERENNVLSPKYARPVERAVQCLHKDTCNSGCSP